MNIKKEIEEMLESCRLSSRPRFYKIGLREIRQLEKLFWEWHKENRILENLKGFYIDIWKILTPRERKVLEIRFGIKDGTTNTLEDVAKEFGVTRERIRQIEANAIEKLKYIGRRSLGQ